MSRTYRRKTRKNTNKKFWYGYSKSPTNDWIYHSDKYNSNPQVRRAKSVTSTLRRSVWRKDKHHIKRHEEHDVYDRNKKYIGLAWYF